MTKLMLIDRARPRLCVMQGLVCRNFEVGVDGVGQTLCWGGRPPDLPRKGLFC